MCRDNEIKKGNYVRSEVFMTDSMKFAVFWDVMPVVK
jgi:hypothetical protein